MTAFSFPVAAAARSTLFIAAASISLVVVAVALLPCAAHAAQIEEVFYSGSSSCSVAGSSIHRTTYPCSVGSNGPCFAYVDKLTLFSDQPTTTYYRVRCDNAFDNLRVLQYNDSNCTALIINVSRPQHQCISLSSSYFAGALPGSSSVTNAALAGYTSFGWSASGFFGSDGATTTVYSEATFAWNETAQFIGIDDARGGAAPAFIAAVCYMNLDSGGDAPKFWYFRLFRESNLVNLMRCATSSCVNCSVHTAFAYNGVIGSPAPFVDLQWTLSGGGGNRIVTGAWSAPLRVRFSGRAVVADEGIFSETQYARFSAAMSSTSCNTMRSRSFYPSGARTCVQNPATSEFGKTQHTYSCSTSLITHIEHKPFAAASSASSFSSFKEHNSTIPRALCAGTLKKSEVFSTSTCLNGCPVNSYYYCSGASVRDRQLSCITSLSPADAVVTIVMEFETAANKATYDSASASLDSGASSIGLSSPVSIFSIVMLVLLVVLLLVQLCCARGADMLCSARGAIPKTWFESNQSKQKREPRLVFVSAMMLLSVAASIIAVVILRGVNVEDIGGAALPVGQYNGTAWTGKDWIVARLLMGNEPSLKACPGWQPEAGNFMAMGGLAISALALHIGLVLGCGVCCMVLDPDNAFKMGYSTSDWYDTFFNYGPLMLLVVVTPLSIAASVITHRAGVDCGVPILISAAWFLAIQATLMVLACVFFLWLHNAKNRWLSHRFLWQTTFLSIAVASFATVDGERAVAAPIVAIIFCVADFIIDIYFSSGRLSGSDVTSKFLIIWLVQGLVGIALCLLAGVLSFNGQRRTEIDVVALVAVVIATAPSIVVCVFGGINFVMALCVSKTIEIGKEKWDEHMQEVQVRETQEAVAAAAAKRAQFARHRAGCEDRQELARQALADEAAMERERIMGWRAQALADKMRTVPCAPAAELIRSLEISEAGAPWVVRFLGNNNNNKNNNHNKTKNGPFNDDDDDDYDESQGVSSATIIRAPKRKLRNGDDIVLPLPAMMFGSPKDVLRATHSRSCRFVAVIGAAQNSSTSNSSENAAWLFDCSSKHGASNNKSTAAGNRVATLIGMVPASIVDMLPTVEPELLHFACAVSFWATKDPDATLLVSSIRDHLSAVQRSDSERSQAIESVRDCVKDYMDRIKQKQAHIASGGAYAGGFAAMTPRSPKSRPGTGRHGTPRAAGEPRRNTSSLVPASSGAAGLGAAAAAAMVPAASGTWSSGMPSPSAPTGNMLVACRNEEGDALPLNQRYKALPLELKQRVQRRSAAVRKHAETVTAAMELLKEIGLPPVDEATAASINKSGGIAIKVKDDSPLAIAVATLQEIVAVATTRSDDKSMSQLLRNFVNQVNAANNNNNNNSGGQKKGGATTVEQMLNIVCNNNNNNNNNNNDSKSLDSIPLPPTSQLPPRLSQCLADHSKKYEQQQEEQQQQKSDSTFSVAKFSHNILSSNVWSWQLLGLLCADLSPAIQFATQIVPELVSTLESAMALQQIVSVFHAEAGATTTGAAALSGGAAKEEDEDAVFSEEFEKKALELEAVFQENDDALLDATIELASVKARHDVFLHRNPRHAAQLFKTMTTLRNTIHALKTARDISITPQYAAILSGRPELAVMLDAPETEMELDDLSAYVHQNLGHGTSRNRLYLAKSSPDQPAWDIVIKQYVLESDKARRRFAREMRLLQRARHPRIMPVLRVFYSPSLDTGYMVMPYCANGTLEQFFHSQARVLDQSQRVLSLEWLRSSIRDILGGLSFLHERDILHLDLKLANIMIGANWECIITDFDVSQDQEVVAAKTMTATSAAGTFGMVAPELRKMQDAISRGQPAASAAAIITSACDIYSLGKTLEIAAAAIQSNFQGMIPPGSEDEKQLLDLIEHMTADDPKQRPAAHEALLHPFLQRGAMQAERNFRSALKQEQERYTQRSQELERVRAAAEKEAGELQRSLAAKQAALDEVVRRDAANAQKAESLGKKATQLSEEVARAEAELKQAKEQAERALQQSRQQIARAEEERRKLAGFLSLPPYWTEYTDSFTNAPPKKVDVTASLKTVIQQLINATSDATLGKGQDQRVGGQYNKLHVEHVFRVENPSLYRRYAQRRYDMESTRIRPSMDPDTIHTMQIQPGGRVDPAKGFGDVAAWIRKLGLNRAVCEVLEFHGTAPSTVDLITNGGFNEKFSNLSGLFGAGIYMAQNASKSDQYATPNSSGHFPLFLARVIVGTPLESRGKHFQNQRIAPLFNDADPAGGRYDSIYGSGLHAHYLETVIYDSAQAYPEYLIFYSRH